VGDEFHGQPGAVDPAVEPEATGDGREDPAEAGDPVEEGIARIAQAYLSAGAPDLRGQPEDEPPDLDLFLRMAGEHGALTGKVAGLAGQVGDLRAALRRVLAATDRYSDNRRASWWLEAHRALGRSDATT